LMKILTRDGAIVWGSLTLYFSIMIRFFPRLHLLVNNAMSFYTAIVSITACRVIMNTLQLNRRESSLATEMTSQYDVVSTGDILSRDLPSDQVPLNFASETGARSA